MAEDANETPAQITAKKKAFETCYATMQKSVADFVAKSQELEDEIYKINEPVARKHEFSPVPSGA